MTGGAFTSGGASKYSWRFSSSTDGAKRRNHATVRDQTRRYCTDIVTTFDFDRDRSETERRYQPRKPGGL
jgi:hypothetical protein